METSTRHGQSTAREREHRGMASREAKGETVLVTGASGFIGSTLARCLLDRGYNVHASVLNPGQYTSPCVREARNNVMVACLGCDGYQIGRWRCR